jgi:hypothetical protein
VVLLPNRENSVPVKVETRVPLPKTPAEDPVASREAAKLAVASEIKQQVQSLKIWISGEMEKSVPVVVSSIMEKMIADAVDKRISADRQTVTQGVNADVARQIEARIAESDDLRTALLGMATKLFEEQAELARATAAKAEQELISRVATAMQSFENPLAEMEARVNIARDAMERLGTRIAESNDQRAVLEDAVKRTFAEQVELSQAARAQAEEELNSRVTTTLQSFEKSLGEMEARVNVARIDMEQVGNRLAETDDLRMGLESAVNRIFEEQAELSRTTVSKIEQELTSRATMILHSFETSLAGMETRISSGRTEMESALARTHTLKQEIEDGMLPIQEGLERLNNAERVGIEQFQSQVEAQLRAAASLFENRLTEISAEKTVQMAMKLDAHLASHRQRADEAVDKLGAVLQLMQGTARVQKEKLTEHSLETAAKFEKEIREILLRLAGRA